jgi:ketosteroid isomerase-like protein
MQPGTQVVREIIEALNAGDIEAMLAHMRPDFEWTPLEASPIARVYRGREEVRHYVEDWLMTFEDLRLELDELREVGDQIVVLVHGQGRGRASGLQLDNSFCQVWTVRGGTAERMEEHETLDDGLAAVG